MIDFDDLYDSERQQSEYVCGKWRELQEGREKE
jgi:hypothetical protein